LNARENRNVFSLVLNDPSESLSVTVLGREFQVAGAEQRKALLANAVLANGSDNRVVLVDVTMSCCLMWGLRYAGVDVFRTLYVCQYRQLVRDSMLNRQPVQLA